MLNEFFIVFFHTLILQRVFPLEKLNHLNWNKVTGINTLRTREFIILHELRHIFGSKHEEEGEFEKDITKILKDCFGVTPDLSQFK